MNDKQKIFFLIVVIVIAPILIFFVVSFALNYFVINHSSCEPVIFFDLKKSVSLTDFLSIYATLLSTGITALLAWTIFYYGKSKERDEDANKRIAILSEIKLMINEVFRYKDKNLSALALPDNWQERITFCRRYLLSEDYSILVEFYGRCFNLSRYDNISEAQAMSVAELILDDIFWDFYKIYKNEIVRREVVDASALVNRTFESILSGIYPGKPKYISNHIADNEYVKYRNGKDLFKFHLGPIYEVWDIEGERICFASFDDNGKIEEGYAKVTEGRYTYSGEWKKGKKNGSGKLYLGDSIASIGTWKDGILYQGEIFNVKYSSAGKKSDEVFYVRVAENGNGTTVQIADFNVHNGILVEPHNVREVQYLVW